MTKVVINVEQKHIDKGQRAESCKCPVALAIMDACPQFIRVAVDSESVLFIQHDDKAHRHLGHPEVSFPKEVGDRIDLFDFDGLMEPFSFTLEIPDAA